VNAFKSLYSEGKQLHAKSKRHILEDTDTIIIKQKQETSTGTDSSLLS
jgi:hypothetical protein